MEVLRDPRGRRDRRALRQRLAVIGEHRAARGSGLPSVIVRIVASGPS
jgi:hypothetical protein